MRGTRGGMSRGDRRRERRRTRGGSSRGDGGEEQGEGGGEI